MSKSLRGDLDLEGQLQLVLETKPLTLRCLPPGPADRLEQSPVLDDLHCLLERLEFIRTEKDSRRSTVTRQDEPLVLAHDLVDELRQVRLRVSERDRFWHRWLEF